MNNKFCSDKKFNFIMILVMITAMIVAVIFCVKKQGFHFDEHYTYYSTNVTCGITMPDGDWKTGNEIRDEFVAKQGEPLGLSVVKLSQSFDVHPPIYYYLVRIVSFITKDVFSKWQGLFINLVFFGLSLFILVNLSKELTDNQYIVLFTELIFGLSPAVISTVMFIRMYMMLVFECLLLMYICVKAIKRKIFKWSNLIVPVMILSFVGFMTHYYFIIFLFFVTAYMCIYMVINKETRVKAFILGGGVCFSLLAAVLYYPACFSHIFRGYRGTEATGAFFDISNTGERLSFFLGLLDKYTFSGTFYIIVTILIMLGLYYFYKNKTSGKKLLEGMDAGAVGLVTFVAIGYFLIVCKSAIGLSEPEESIRYQSPAYSIIILVIVLFTVMLLRYITKYKWPVIVALAVVTVMQLVGLCSGKVMFLFENAADNYAFSKEHSQDTVAYIFSRNNEWMIWNDATELMEYENIYFVDYQNSDFSDDKLKNAGSILVYACRSDETKLRLDKLIEENSSLSSCEKIEERLYVDIYQLK